MVMRISSKMVERTETRKGHGVASNVELSSQFLSGSQAEQQHPVTKHAPEAPPASCSPSSLLNVLC